MTKADRNTGVAVEHTFYKVSVGRIELEAILSVPNEAQGIVLFAHGSGSTHRSPRNRFVADVINEASLATLLIDLLSSEEQQVDLQTAHLRFNIPFLADRLTAISDWLDCQKAIGDLPLGLFGASTG